MEEVFVVGSINQDFVLEVERRPQPGETLTDARLSTHNGGKGANQAAAAALLGASVVFLGRVGDDAFGEPLVRALAEKGVDTSLVEAAPESSTGTAFITVTPDGENAITVAPGANRSLVPEDVDAASAEIAEARVLVVQMEVPPEVVLRAVEVAAENGTRALLNLAPPFEVPRGLLERLDPLVVNEHEAAFLLGETVEGVDGALAAAPELLSLGPESAVITVGAAGAVFSDGETTAHVPAPKADVVDTTGAGDAFVGALAAQLARGTPLEDAVAYAARAGAAAVTKEGAQGALPTPETMVKAHREAVFRRFYEVAWNEGDLSVVDELLSADFVNHEAGDARTPHRELYKRGIVRTRAAYPDWTLVIEDLATEGDRVTARWRAHGTHTGSIEGIPATGKRDEFSGVTVVRVVDGKIAEFWKQQSEIQDR